MKNEIEMIDVTWRAILKVIAAIILFWIIYLLKDVIVWILLALFISIIFNPLIDFIEKKKIKRVFATILVYFSSLLIIALMLLVIIPPLVTEVQYFSATFSQYFDKLPILLDKLGLNSLEGITSLNSSLNDSIIKMSSNILNIFTSLFGSIFAGLTIFVLSIFMSLEEKEIIKGLNLITPKGFEEQVLERWKRSQHQVVAWFGSRILSCICVALMTFLLCVFLKIKFALALALLAGVLNMIPMIGPIIAAVVLIGVALTVSIPKAIIAGIFTIIIQQVESNVLMPILAKKMVGMSSVLVLISILVGGILGGIIGAVLAIPIAGIVFEGVKDYFNHKKKVN